MLQSRHGFTLIEISIVLAILGLLVGGILAGQTLIHAQKLKNVLVQASTYRVAIQQFEEKYGGLPGDLPDAERIWGSAGGGAYCGLIGGSPAEVPSVGTSTCNGDGNGILNDKFEAYRTWQQLAAAGYITGNFVGIPGGVADVNFPRGPLEGSGYLWGGGYGYTMDYPDFFPAKYGNILLFGIPNENYSQINPVLIPAEAASLDQKADDGLPGQGSIVTFPINSSAMGGNNTACATTNDSSTALYQVDSTANACALMFTSQFKSLKNQ